MPRAKTQWIVVADGAKARIFSRLAPAGALDLIHDRVSAEARHPTQELGAERPGRTFDSATPNRHALEPRGDFQEQAKEAFLKGLAKELGPAALEGLFHELILVAAPRALHVLRDTLPAAARARLVGTLDKDLTGLAVADLPRYLEAA